MNRKVLTITLAVLLALLLSVGGATGQEPEGDVRPQGGISIAATVGSRISYQGILKEGGTPVTGERDMTFRLYSNSTCSTQEGSDIAMPGVTVTEGLFSVKLNVSHPRFNGQGLWLGVDVGNTGANVVCEEILPAPYALSLRPGASIIGAQPGSVIYVSNTSTGHGIFAVNSTTQSTKSGVTGWAQGTSGTTYGVHGRSYSTAGRGVYGWASATSGTTYGVYGESRSTDGTGVYGYATATSGTTYGVYGQSDSTEGSGVYGWSTATSAQSTTAHGVHGRSDNFVGAGVYGESSGGEGKGVYGLATTTDPYLGPSGVFGKSDATTGNRYGVTGYVSGTGYGLYTSDNLYVGGSCSGCTMVFIARNTSGDTLRVGDVVAASGVGPVLQGHTSPVLQVRRATAGDASVLGVVYMRGEFYAARGDQLEEDGDSVHPVEGDVAPGDYLLVVTSGLAQVRVTTDLTPGQRLTVGDTAGLATLAGTNAQPSLVLGRAMEAQPDESGLLWAMISVQ